MPAPAIELAFDDETNWRDDGCEVSPACCVCPLSMCRHDFHNDLVGAIREDRNARIRAMAKAGRSHERIAREFCISRQRVHQIVARGVPSPQVRRGRPTLRW